MGNKTPPSLTYHGDQPQQQEEPRPTQDDTINTNEEYETIIESLRRGPITGQKHMLNKDKGGGRAYDADTNAQPDPDPPQPRGAPMRELLNGKQISRAKNK